MTTEPSAFKGRTLPTESLFKSATSSSNSGTRSTMPNGKSSSPHGGRIPPCEEEALRPAKKSKQTNAENGPDIRLPYDDIVCIIVGKDNDIKEFRAHKSTICKGSIYLTRKFASETVPTLNKEPTIALPDQKPAIFELYQHWCYSNLLIPTAMASTSRDVVLLYIMAVLFQHSEVQNSAIKRLLEIENWPGGNEVTLIYQKTEPGSPLRRLLVDRMVRKLSNKEFKELFGNNAINKENEFLCDLFLAERRRSAKVISKPGARVVRRSVEGAALVDSDYLVPVVIEVD